MYMFFFLLPWTLLLTIKMKHVDTSEFIVNIKLLIGAA